MDSSLAETGRSYISPPVKCPINALKSSYCLYPRSTISFSPYFTKNEGKPRAPYSAVLDIARFLDDFTHGSAQRAFEQVATQCDQITFGIGGGYASPL